jgi:hypothetical protein
MSTAKVFTLKFPFEYRGTTYTVFQARRPKVKDIRKFIKSLEADPVLAMEQAIADLVEIEPEVIAEIDIEDFAPIKNWFEAFLAPMANG